MVLFTVSDIKWRLLPHLFNNLFILAGFIFSNNGSIFNLSSMYSAVCNFILIGAVLYAVTQVIPRGMGGGDIKMGAGLTIWLGLSKVLLTFLLAFGIGSLVVLPLLKLKIVSKKSMIPFGPFLALGALLIWFCPGLIIQLGM